MLQYRRNADHRTAPHEVWELIAPTVWQFHSRYVRASAARAFIRNPN